MYIYNTNLDEINQAKQFYDYTISAEVQKFQNEEEKIVHQGSPEVSHRSNSISPMNKPDSNYEEEFKEVD